jgi:hypothetical protein
LRSVTRGGVVTLSDALCSSFLAPIALASSKRRTLTTFTGL